MPSTGDDQPAGRSGGMAKPRLTQAAATTNAVAPVPPPRGEVPLRRELRAGVGGLEVVHLDQDRLDLLGAQVVPLGQGEHGVDRRLVEHRGRVALEGDVQDLPARAEVVGQVLDALGAAGEGVVEADRPLQRRGRGAGALLGEVGGEQAAAGGLARPGAP